MQHSTTSNQLEFFSQTEMGTKTHKAGSSLIQLLSLSVAMIAVFGIFGGAL